MKPMRPMTKVLAWTLFVVLFGLAYAVYSGGKPAHAFVIGGGALVTMTAIVYLRRLVGRGDDGREFLTDDQKAHEAVLRGDLEEARNTYDKWRGSKIPQIASAAAHLVATLDMRLGRSKEAIALLDDYARTSRGPLLPHTTVLLATNHALLGDLDAAKSWLDKTPATAPRNYEMPAAQIAFAQALIDCRSGRCADAARLLDERWPEIESQLKAHQLPPYRILRAFAHANAGVRNAGIAEAELAVVRPKHPGEHDYLGKAWPEMATFLAANNLSGGSGAPGPKPEARSPKLD